MPFFGGGIFEKNDRDYDRVVRDSRDMRKAITLALEIVAEKDSLGASEIAELRVALRNGLKD